MGVITPFRAQIAMIRSKMDNGYLTENMSIDTVERYQGSAREHIFISLAITKANMLESISNLSHEGVDRKLNVALTRAKENVVIFGNRELLKKSQIYNELIDASYQLTLKDLDNLD